MSRLLATETRILIQGITGREAIGMVRSGLDYGAKIVAGVTPGKGGQEVYGVPVFDTVEQAQAHSPVDASMISVPPMLTRDAAMEAIEAGIALVVITTERIPRRDVAQILEAAQRRGVRVVGPNSLGLIAPGMSKIGSVGGSAADTARAYSPGPVGIMSRSGGMTTEIASLLTQSGIGQSICVSMGGDPIIGSDFADLYRALDADPQTQVVVIYTEPGGSLEVRLAEYLRRARPRTPGIVFIAGRFMDEMKGVRFGHAGTIVQGPGDSAGAKAELLAGAGLTVAENLSDLPRLVGEALARYPAEGVGS